MTPGGKTAPALRTGLIAAGLALGALNLGTAALAVLFALRDGLSGPSPWYDLPVCLVLLFGPVLAWTVWNVRLAYRDVKSGCRAGSRCWQCFLYVTSLPAGTALMAWAWSALR